MILHVLNGDTTAAALARSALPGTHLPFREALATGPAPAEVGGEEWRARRAAHLAAECRGSAPAIAARLERQDEELGSCREHDEVVLWFEPDLFCQANQLYVLDRLAGSTAAGDVAAARGGGGGHPGATPLLSLVEPSGGAGGPERPYSTLEPRDLARLYERRRPVGDAELGLARRAWHAWRSPDPTALEAVVAGDTSPLPHLAEALLLHLARFPSTRNGLGRVENAVLQLLAAGATQFAPLFRAFCHEQPGYGLGDLQVLAVLDRLATAPEPLVVRENGAAPERYRLTDAGRRALQGEWDTVEAGHLDLWLGGVHLHPAGPVWRWDEQRSALLPDRGGEMMR